MKQGPVECEQIGDSSSSDSVTPGKRTRDFSLISLEGKVESPAKKQKLILELENILKNTNKIPVSAEVDEPDGKRLS